MTVATPQQGAGWEINPEAPRLLTNARGAVPVDVADGVLHVVADHTPTPAEFEQWSATSGLDISTTVVSPTEFGQVAAAAQRSFDTTAPLAVGQILAGAEQQGATDVLLVTGDRPRARISGLFAPMDNHPRLSAADVLEAGEWLAAGQSEALANYGQSRWRVELTKASGLPMLAARRLPSTVPDLADLGLPPGVLSVTADNTGLVVVAGPAGSGRTTTAAALAGRLASDGGHLAAVVSGQQEYRMKPGVSAVVHKTVPDPADLRAAVRSAVRCGASLIVVDHPDVAASTAAAADAANAGVQVLMTLPALSAQAAAETLAAHAETGVLRALEAIVFQRLTQSDSGPQVPTCSILGTPPQVRKMITEGRMTELPAFLQDNQ